MSKLVHRTPRCTGMTRPGVPSGNVQNEYFAMEPRLERVFEARWLIKVGTPYTWGHKLIKVGTPETAKCTNISGVPKNYGTHCVPKIKAAQLYQELWYNVMRYTKNHGAPSCTKNYWMPVVPRIMVHTVYQKIKAGPLLRWGFLNEVYDVPNCTESL